MIVVDTSALMAIILDEEAGASCAAVLAQSSEILISAATLAEALVVADRRRVGRLMRAAIHGLPIATVACGEATAARVAAIYSRWRKGEHAARLGLIDCFAYDLAVENDCPLLYVGSDFAQTDVVSAVSG
jgi:ribonuclease VapC